MGHPIKGLVFDKDGTLFEFRATWNQWGADLVEHLGETPRERKELADALGYDAALGTFRDDSLVIAGTPREIIEVIQAFRPNEDPTGLYERVMATTHDVPQVEAAPLVPLLETLRAHGLLLGVATNDAEAPARSHLRSAGIEGLFDHVFGYDSGFGAKPGPGMLNAFLAKTGLEAQEAAMIGDSTHDLAAGRAAGMATIGVLTGTADARTLAPLADAVLPSIAALPEHLGLG